ncbi:MAG: SpoIIE family protein phosphatase [Bacteroidota bacterium]|nr:SpoIIE family protein phosphatase [Bacteroidota bacterium]
MISNQNVIRLSILFGIISWASLLIIDLFFLFGDINHIATGISPEVPLLLLNLFIVFVFLYYKFKIGKAESINFIDLLWRVFVTGLLTVIVSLIIRSFYYLVGSNNLVENPLLINFFYHINLGLIVAFLISTFIVWKRLILYQKSKRLLRTWHIFEYSLLASIIFNFFNYRIFDVLFNIIFSILFAMGIILSVNLKWVAYLNFKQKWKSILLIIIVIVYLLYFINHLFTYSSNYRLSIDLLNNVFILTLFAFIFLYAIFSLLVILFNLPTSSVFEQKLEEVLNFQRLSQSIQAGQKEEKVYDILLDSSVSAVSADAAWLEIFNEQSDTTEFHTRNVPESTIEEIKQQIYKSKFKNMLAKGTGIGTSTYQNYTSLSGSSYKSILMIPVTVQNNKIGTLVLLKEIEDGFNKEMIDILNSFASQASISIENSRLVSEAIENERYKEELKIAKRVQRSLLPKKVEHNLDFDLYAFSEAADEVGGDYYDTYQISEHKLALIIGDVSGKGTSAAFNMSQMKGVFHSLVQLDLSPKDFMIYANDALSRCLEKTSFITISFFVIDSKTKKICFARAGHCPTLIFTNNDKEAKYYTSKGLGLGIIRNSNFHNYVHVNEFGYKQDDIVLLYTDGITEAKNGQGAEYGYERLKEFLMHNANKTPDDFQEALIKDLYDFCGTKVLDDDYTTLILKFK